MQDEFIINIEIGDVSVDEIHNNSNNFHWLTTNYDIPFNPILLKPKY